MPLSELENGCRGVIAENRAFGSIRRRLYDMGFSEGAMVECVGESMLSNPRAYFVKGAVIALRNTDACKIIIK